MAMTDPANHGVTHSAAEAADELRRLRSRITELEGRSERLRIALGLFIDDDRFVVAVGGNPNAAEAMVSEARKIYDQS